MCSTLKSCPSSRQSSIASARGISSRSKRSSALMIFCISASIRGKSSSESGCGELEIVVEAAARRRPERQLHALEQPHDGLGHDMGTAVPHDGERFGVLFCQQPQADFATGRQWAVQIDLFAVDFGQNRRLGQPLADFERHVVGRHGTLELFPTSIGQNDNKHVQTVQLR